MLSLRQLGRQTDIHGRTLALIARGVFYPVGISVPLLETAVFGCGAWSRCADAVISQFTLQHHIQVTLALSWRRREGGGGALPGWCSVKWPLGLGMLCPVHICQSVITLE